MGDNPNASSSEIVVPPFIADAIEEIQHLTKFGRMVDLGFTLGAQLPALMKLFHSASGKSPEAKAGLETFAALSDELNDYAKEQCAAGMPYLRALLTIRYVTIIETVVQDAVLVSIETVPEVMKREEMKRVKGPIAALLAAPPAERAEFFAGALAQESKASLQTGANRFEAILETVGLNGAVDDFARRVIHELLQVRNVLVHRNGRADARVCGACPWLDLKPGDKVVVTAEMSEAYRSAALYYLIELIRRWFHRAGAGARLVALDNVATQALAKLQALTTGAG